MLPSYIFQTRPRPRRPDAKLLPDLHPSRGIVCPALGNRGDPRPSAPPKGKAPGSGNVGQALARAAVASPVLDPPGGRAPPSEVGAQGRSHGLSCPCTGPCPLSRILATFEIVPSPVGGVSHPVQESQRRVPGAAARTLGPAPAASLGGIFPRPPHTLETRHEPRSMETILWPQESPLRMWDLLRRVHCPTPFQGRTSGHTWVGRTGPALLDEPLSHDAETPSKVGHTCESL